MTSAVRHSLRIMSRSFEVDELVCAFIVLESVTLVGDSQADIVQGRKCFRVFGGSDSEENRGHMFPNLESPKRRILF